MADVLSEYLVALERLKAGRTVHVPQGTKITNDSVAMEAGRGKGSIKKSRSIFTDLITAIRVAASEQAAPEVVRKNRLENTKQEAMKYRTLYEAGLARELSLLHEIEDLKSDLRRLRDLSKVTRLGQ
jgi:hypothetical protein